MLYVFCKWLNKVLQYTNRYCVCVSLIGRKRENLIDRDQRTLNTPAVAPGVVDTLCWRQQIPFVRLPHPKSSVPNPIISVKCFQKCLCEDLHFQLFKDCRTTIIVLQITKGYRCS